MEFVSGKPPPRIAGDVTIARFFCKDASEKWRVSVGHGHFLTDRLTARKMFVLAGREAVEHTYAAVYSAYRETVENPETIEHFVEWCEKNRARLEGLADTAETHALRHRRVLLPATTCERIAAWLGWLFRPTTFFIVWIAALVLIAIRSLRHGLPAAPGNFWLAAALALCGIFLHELGHITACVRHGARQGGIGVGLYWIWPAFYADVRGGWVLGHVERAVISLGGLYFQSIYLATICAIELTTGDGTLSIAIGISTLLMLTTLNPVFKYDGYWILSDLLNITNLHTRIGSHLQALLVSDRMARRPLLRTRMTGVAVGFALVATAYILYLLEMMLRMVAGEVSRLPGLWFDASQAIDRHLPIFGEAGLNIARFSSTLLGVTFLSLAICVLGYRSLRSAQTILVQP